MLKTVKGAFLMNSKEKPKTEALNQYGARHSR
jgi:hypothetical protein